MSDPQRSDPHASDPRDAEPRAGEPTFPVRPNPYTDDSPLQAHEHPWRGHRSMAILAVVVAAAPLLWLVVRLVGGMSPLVPPALIVALAVGEPLAVLIAMFPVLLASGAHVTLGATTLTRRVHRGRGETKTIRLADIRAGIFASNVRYRVDSGAELVLFLGGGEILWIADGIEPADVRRIAEALSSYGVREHAEAITNEQLAALVRRARRVDGAEGEEPTATG